VNSLNAMRVDTDPVGQAGRRVFVLGCPVDPVDEDGAVRLCLEWCAAGSKGHHVVTINAYAMMLMRERPSVHTAVADAALVVPDGISVIWGARILGLPIRYRVTGVELTRRLMQEGKALRFYFLGSTQEVLDSFIPIVRARYPEVVIAGSHNGFFSRGDEPAIVKEIRQSRADILLVAFPNPLAEEWIYRNKEGLGASVIMGVGGTFDVMSGNLRRAPRLIQRIGFEWAWRILLEPRKRWRIGLVYLPRYVLAVFGERLRSLGR